MLIEKTNIELVRESGERYPIWANAEGVMFTQLFRNMNRVRKSSFCDGEHYFGSCEHRVYGRLRIRAGSRPW